MSVILSIYDAIAAISVTVSGTTPTVYDLDELKDSYKSADLPARLLLPVGVDAPADAREGQFIALGSTTRTRWRITDLMLWKMAGRPGTGLDAVAEDLVAYAGAYVEALRSNRGLGLSTVVIDAWQATPMVVEWPDGSGNAFFAVKCYVDVIEVHSS